MTHPNESVHDDGDEVGVLSWLRSIADSSKPSESGPTVVPVAP